MKTFIDISSLPPSVMMWTINDEVIEDLQLLEKQFHDIRAAGFSGVAVFVRCSRYTWDDDEARTAFKKISELCKRYRLHFWIGLDPRLISHSLIKGSKGLHVIVFGDKPRADHVPNVASVHHNKFSLRCTIEPRPVHTLNEVAIEYYPIGIYRVFAFRKLKNEFSLSDIIDITKKSHFFYNAREHYVEAFGSFIPPDTDEWCVISFFLFETNHFDYSNPKQVERYIKKVKRFHKEEIQFDGLMWDEPGYTCMFGTLPFSINIQKLFKDETGLTLQKNIWKLACEPSDKSHIEVRNNFYRIIQSTVNEAQEKSNHEIQQLNRRPIIFGIHDTWRWESADMCDMNHGSLDLWRASKSKSGGFTDLGSVNLLKETNSSFYANLATMSVISASLGRHHVNKFAYNNLWTMDEDHGKGWQQGVMDHCVNVMAMFGTHWLAHIYGPSGIIGEENSFLGLPTTPGYPYHSTWQKMSEWNERLKKHLEIVRHKLPEANILLIFPVESLYAFADTRANQAAKNIFDLLLGLTDAHYQIDVVSAHCFSEAKIINGQIYLNNNSYDVVIYPYPTIIDERIYSLMNKVQRDSIFVFDTCRQTFEGKKIFFHDVAHANTADELCSTLKTYPQAQRIRAPLNSWVSITPFDSGSIITLTPSRYGYTFKGNVTFHGKTISLEEQNGLVRIRFPKKGRIQILD